MARESGWRREQGRVFLRGLRWWLAFYHQGREIRESSGSTDQRKASNLLKDRLGAIYSGRFIAPDQVRVTVGELIESLRLEMSARAPKGWYTLKGMFPRLTAAMGHHRAIAVTAELLRAYERELHAKGLAKATRGNYLWLLKAAFRLGMKDRRVGLMPEFPKLGALKNARRGFVEPEMLTELIGHLPSRMAQDIVRFAYGCGWREAEVLGLRWEMVDRRGQEIRLPDSKNDQPRTLPLMGELAAIIERRWTDRVVGDRLIRWVFHHPNGRPVAPTTLRKWWRAAREGAGHPGLLFHDLRRSAVRNLIRAGVTEPVAMSISGHRSPSVFRRYNITTVDDQRRALAVTQAYVAAKQKPASRREQR